MSKTGKYEIEEKMLKVLLQASPKALFIIKTIEGGFTLSIRVPKDLEDPTERAFEEFVLNRQLGGIRVWRSLDKLHDYIARLNPDWEKIEIYRE